jgi:hypothetical protein
MDVMKKREQKVFILNPFREFIFQPLKDRRCSGRRCGIFVENLWNSGKAM